MANDPNIAAIAGYAGKYEKKLLAKLINELDLLAEGITVVPGVKSKLTMTKLVIGKGAKPYTGVHKAKSDISYTPRVLEVQDCQRDLTIEPKKYRTTYLEEQRGKGENSKNMNIPFAKFTNEQIVKELAAEINDNTIWDGVGKAGFVAFDGGTAYAVGDLVTFSQEGEVRYFECVEITLPGESPDTHEDKWEWAGAKALCVGFSKILTDEAAAGEVQVVVTGAVTPTNAYAKFSQMFRELPVAVRKAGVIIHCSWTDYFHLADDFEDKVTKNIEVIDGVTYLAKTNKKCLIKPVSWITTRRLIATVPGNLKMGTDEENDMNTIKTIENMYTLDMGITWVMGFQVQDLEAMAISDQT